MNISFHNPKCVQIAVQHLFKKYFKHQQNLEKSECYQRKERQTAILTNSREAYLAHLVPVIYTEQLF
jgi:hypothetical protein